MCRTCGCDEGAKATITDAHGHTHVLPDGSVVSHDHDHDHGSGHSHDHAERETIVLEQALLAKNDALAERNRAWQAERGLLSLNLMSSPGAGKTTLLERVLRELDLPAVVIEGDQETALDAERIRATGTPAVQVNTGTGCHLEADMVHAGLERLAPAAGSVVFIENVGNLVCPALFDLGETARIVLFSTTEGEDKPIKYPHMFRTADLVLLTKSDLLPYLDFDKEQGLKGLRTVAPDAEVLEVSSKTGAGLPQLYAWIRARAAEGSHE